MKKIIKKFRPLAFVLIVTLLSLNFYGCGGGKKGTPQPSDVWQKTYGGSRDDRASSIQQTSDGGYIVAGYTTSFGAGAADSYIIKLDASGSKLWEKTYGGSSRWDVARSIQQTSDGGYIVAGRTESFGAGGRDFYIIKLDANGNTGSYPAKSKPAGISKMKNDPFDDKFLKHR